MKKTILHISKYYYPREGGIESVARSMAEGLTEFNNIVICFSHDGTTRLDTINDVKVYRIASHFKVASQDIAFSYYSNLKKVIQQYQPDVILLHCPNPFLYPIVCRLKPENSKLVLLWHSDILGKGLLYKMIKRRELNILRKSDLILTTSSNYIHPSSPIYDFRDKIKVVPNSINTFYFAISEDEKVKINEIRERYGNKKIILFIGRHVKYKGLEYLISAEQYIKSDCIILIGGSGPETKSLKKMANSNRIQFIDRIPEKDLKYYYYASDIFAFTSVTKQEAFGVVLLEAMYCKCVPVTFTIEGSGVNWVSVKGETCEEVPLCDEKAYAAAIDRLLTDHALYERYAENGRKRVEGMFTAKIVNQEAAVALKELLYE